MTVHNMDSLSHSAWPISPNLDAFPNPCAGNIDWHAKVLNISIALLQMEVS
jgi:hypothetical protein